MMIALLLFSLSASAKTFEWHEISALDCKTPGDLTISLESQRYKMAGREYFPDGARYVVEDEITEISFTGHQPSAGPVLDPHESDFSIWTAGRLTGGRQSVSGLLMVSKAYGPFERIDKISCTVESREIFSR